MPNPPPHSPGGSDHDHDGGHHHRHDHGHDHDHAHGHSHDLAEFAAMATGRRFVWAMALNLLFVVIESGFGLYADSLSLLADAGHNFSDVIGLFAAWIAMLLARQQPTARFTYGLRSSTILAALANAMILLIAVGGVVWEAFQRLSHPQPVAGLVITGVALAGVAVNFGTGLLLMQGREHDLNQRGAFLHMMSDAAVSAGVAAGGLLVMRTGWLWLDPAISLLIALVIFASTWNLLRESLQLALQAVPDRIDPLAVRAFLDGLPQVSAVHDLHVWGMSTTENALTVHLVTPGGHPGDGFLRQTADDLQQRFNIQHATIQIEVGDTPCFCPLAADGTV